MAKAKNKKARRQGWASKLMNAGLIALGFSRVIKWFIRETPLNAIEGVIDEATFGLGGPTGKFDLKKGLAMYTPAGAAIALGYLKSYLIKKFPIRG